MGLFLLRFSLKRSMFQSLCLWQNYTQGGVDFNEDRTENIIFIFHKNKDDPDSIPGEERTMHIKTS